MMMIDDDGDDDDDVLSLFLSLFQCGLSVTPSSSFI